MADTNGAKISKDTIVLVVCEGYPYIGNAIPNGEQYDVEFNKTSKFTMLHSVDDMIGQYTPLV